MTAGVYLYSKLQLPLNLTTKPLSLRRRDAYLYRVVSLSIVGPDDTRVLDSDGGEALTLITCHPFYFVGGAPDDSS